jgi:hypothetical protein
MFKHLIAAQEGLFGKSKEEKEKESKEKHLAFLRKSIEEHPVGDMKFNHLEVKELTKTFEDLEVRLKGKPSAEAFQNLKSVDECLGKAQFVFQAAEAFSKIPEALNKLLHDPRSMTEDDSHFKKYYDSYKNGILPGWRVFGTQGNFEPVSEEDDEGGGRFIVHGDSNIPFAKAGYTIDFPKKIAALKSSIVATLPRIISMKSQVISFMNDTIKIYENASVPSTAYGSLHDQMSRTYGAGRSLKTLKVPGLVEAKAIASCYK